MRNICIIPARGGSKRIPRKNIKEFLGIPIIAYAIKNALETCLFDEVIVSTDDEEIKKIALKHGAKVPFLRNNKTANDFATTFDVIEETLNHYLNQNQYFDNILCLYPCSALINSKIIINAFNKFTAENYTSLVPIVAFNFPIQRAFKIEDNKISYFYPQFEISRSQDLVKSYHDAGQFYWLKSVDVLSQKKIITNNTGYIELNELETQDIDNIIDWQMMEFKYQFNKQNQK